MERNETFMMISIEKNTFYLLGLYEMEASQRLKG